MDLESFKASGLQSKPSSGSLFVPSGRFLKLRWWWAQRRLASVSGSMTFQIQNFSSVGLALNSEAMQGKNLILKRLT